MSITTSSSSRFMYPIIPSSPPYLLKSTHARQPYNINIRIPLTDHDLFDVASCQFALHYMFQTLERADHFFGQVAKHLVHNGLFIVTTIDCRCVCVMLEMEEL